MASKKTRKYKVTTLEGIVGVPKRKQKQLHRLPDRAFRITACGEVSPIMFQYLTATDIIKYFPSRCEECWKNTTLAKENNS